MFDLSIQFIIVSFFTAMLLVVVTFLLLDRKNYLTPATVEESCKKIQNTSKLDPSHSILEAHKIVIGTINEMNKSQDNAAKTLERVIERLPDEKTIWKFHRMRNRIAHELDYKVNEQEAKEARNIFKKAIRALQKH